MNILITGIGGDIGFNLVKLVKKHFPSFQVLGADMNAENMGRTLIDKFFQVPAASSPNYMEEIGNLVNKEKINCVLPATEQEQTRLSSDWHSLKSDGHLICQSSENLSIFLDKFNTVEFLNKHNIPAPKTSLASNKCSQDFPIILKARKGRGNTAVFKITSEEDLKKHSKNQTSEFVFQELLSPDDEEYTCGVYKSRIDNSIHTIVLKRTLGTDSTIKAELVEDQEISDYVEAIAKASSMHGSFNIQLRKTTSGPFCFEVNPRFSSTIVMRDMLGFQDVLWSINEIMGDAATYNGPSHPSGTIIYKTPDFLMM